MRKTRSQATGEDDFQCLKKSIDELKESFNGTFVDKILSKVSELFLEKFAKLEEKKLKLEESNKLLLDRVNKLEQFEIKLNDEIAVDCVVNCDARSSANESFADDEEYGIDDEFDAKLRNFTCDVDDVASEGDRYCVHPNPTPYTGNRLLTGLQPPNQVKTHIHTLLLSDSIMKYVDVTTLPGNVMKKVIPGARCDKLFLELTILNQQYTFDEVILHCGTNYINANSYVKPCFVENDICNFLSATRDLLPLYTIITFSPILPKYNNGWIPVINRINSAVFQHTATLPRVDYISSYTDFARDRHGYFNNSLICWDAVHLSFGGVRSITRSLSEHILFRFG